MLSFWVILIVIITVTKAVSSDLDLSKSGVKHPISPIYPKEAAKNQTTGETKIRIVGGVTVNLHSLPYQAGIISTSGNHSRFCGGALISTRFILTAAHCVVNSESVHVILGAHFLLLPENYRFVGEYTSKSIIIHEEYTGTANDIAIVSIATPVPDRFKDFIYPIQLPDRQREAKKNYIGKIALASGWGYSSDGSHVISLELRAVNLTIISRSRCRRTFGTSVRVSNICTSGVNGKSICDGDSGGPLALRENDGRLILIGLTSFAGTLCEKGIPQVFTRMYSYLEWIHYHTDIVVEK